MRIKLRLTKPLEYKYIKHEFNYFKEPLIKHIYGKLLSALNNKANVQTGIRLFITDKLIYY